MHARQVPQLPALQHTPSTQLPLVHSPAALHAVPSGRSPMQVPLLQKLPGAQSWSAVQAVRHEAAPQTYAPQLWVAGCVHAPAPLHCDAGW